MGGYDPVTSILIIVGIVVVIFGARALWKALSSPGGDDPTEQTHEFKQCPSCGWEGKVSKFHKKCSKCGAELL